MAVNVGRILHKRAILHTYPTPKTANIYRLFQESVQDV